MTVLRDVAAEDRRLAQKASRADLVVVGGGLAGTCCAITAARAGLKTTLIQDRPVLGGNASSEIRMVTLGATASGANNNRWAREGGVVNEFLVENVYRNPLGNPLLSDVILLDMVAAEPNVELLLNTAVFEGGKTDAERISHVRGYCSQTETIHQVSAPWFCDASGDGIVGFLGGAAYRIGAESVDEFGEPLAPDESYGELLGHSIYFQTKDAGRPVPFVAPRFALDDITKITRWKRITPGVQGRDLWWLEYGGRLDTIHDTETIKWELWRIVYGIWNYVKNSGEFPEAETLTLEWVGTVPGKRESRRFEGDYVLTQRDVVERAEHPDAVSYGGWSMDLHPADGVYSEHPPCTQWHAKGVYPIPFRALYSRNITNLFLAGRIISASHVAFGSTRVMATCAHTAQAVGMAAAICEREGITPAELSQPGRVETLQMELAREGQFIPGYRLEDPDDLARRATITASSRLRLGTLPADGALHRLKVPRGMLLPVGPGRMPRVMFTMDADEETELTVSLRSALKPDEYTPERTWATRTVGVAAGERQAVSVDFGIETDEARYVLVCLDANEHVSIHGSRMLVTGVKAVANCGRADVTSGALQTPPEGLGVDTFEFWRPLPGTEGENLAVTLDTPLDAFGPEAVVNGAARPTSSPNAWVADPGDAQPVLTLRWPEPQEIGRVELTFDTDWDNPLFSVLHEHPYRVLPGCVREYRILDGDGNELARRDANYQTRNTIRFVDVVRTSVLRIELARSGEGVPVAVYEVRCYEE
jgi:hypothetical protein